MFFQIGDELVVRVTIFQQGFDIPGIGEEGGGSRCMGFDSLLELAKPDLISLGVKPGSDDISLLHAHGKTMSCFRNGQFIEY